MGKLLNLGDRHGNVAGPGQYGCRAGLLRWSGCVFCDIARDYLHLHGYLPSAPKIAPWPAPFHPRSRRPTPHPALPTPQPARLAAAAADRLLAGLAAWLAVSPTERAGHVLDNILTAEASSFCFGVCVHHRVNYGVRARFKEARIVPLESDEAQHGLLHLRGFPARVCLAPSPPSGPPPKAFPRASRGGFFGLCTALGRAVLGPERRASRVVLALRLAVPL